MAPFVLTQACHIRHGEFHWSVWSEYSGLSASVRGENTDNSVCTASPSYNTDAPNEPLEISHSGTHIAGQRVVIMLCWHEIYVLKLLSRIFHTLYSLGSQTATTKCFAMAPFALSHLYTFAPSEFASS